MRISSSLLLFLLSIFLLISLVPQVPAGPVQPPVITSTLYSANVGWGPRRADPARAYDTGSGELIFNVYDTLITFGEPMSNSFKSDWAVNEQHWTFSPALAEDVPERIELVQDFVGVTAINATKPCGTILTRVPPDGNDYVIYGWVDSSLDGFLDEYDVLYISTYFGGVLTESRTWQTISFDAGTNTLHLHRFYYDLNIRTSPEISFVNETGQVVDTFDVEDAQYSLMRGLVQDQTGSPQWMFYRAFFDQMNGDYWAASTADAVVLAHMINSSIEIPSPDVLRLNLGIAFPDTGFKQVLAQTWGSIVSKGFSLSIGCWNGDLLTDGNGDGWPDWWNTTRRINRSPYDTTSAYRYVGTGPYRITQFDSVNRKVVYERNVLHWKGWPAQQRKAYLNHIETDYIADWAPRRDAFIASQYDTCAVPRAYINELLDQYGESRYPEIKVIKNISPELSLNAAHFTFTLNATSPYIGTGHFPDGIPLDFYNSTHVRRAFAYSFNHTRWLSEVRFGDATCPSTPLLRGLYPDYHKGISGYDISFDMAEDELKNAMFDGQSVWNSGFSMSLVEIASYDQEIFCYYIRDFFDILSTYDSRVGPPFKISVAFAIWPEYMDEWEAFKLPIWSIGWAADFADADNFMRPYMCSNGDFAYFQNYTTANGWDATRGTNYPSMNKDQLIEAGFRTPDGPQRAGMYADLETIYIADCPSFLTDQLTRRRWCKYWVKGWYYNPLYPGDYYYNMYKERTCWADVTGPTVGVPDGLGGDMRDIGYVAGHFGAVAPDTAKTPPYNGRWAPGAYGAGSPDVYGDRKVDMRDIGFMCAHFIHTTQP